MAVLSAQDTAVPSTLMLPYKALCVVLSVVICFFGLIPRTNSVIDEYTQIEKAEAAIPLVVIPIAATLFSLAGVAVVGATQDQYNVNLEKCWNDFIDFTGQTSEALTEQLVNAVGDDGMIALDLLTSGFLSNLDIWAASLGASEVEDSNVKPLTEVDVDGNVFAFQVTDDDLSLGKGSYGNTQAVIALFPYLGNPDLMVGVHSYSTGGVTIYYNTGTGHYSVGGHNQSSFTGSTATYCTITSGKSWVPNSYVTTRYIDDLSTLRIKSGMVVRFADSSSSKSVILDLSTGEFKTGAGSVSGGMALGGAVAGALTGSVLAGSKTWGDFADKVKVWTPTADQIAAGYGYADVLDGTGALEGTQGGEGGGETGDTDTGSLLNKILAALTLLLGLDRIPAILDGINNALTGWWDALMAWCADVWAWMQSLNMAQWLSDVWGFLTGSLVSLLSPLALLWEWLQSLGLAQWLAQLWDWIVTLDLAGALQGILDAVLNFPKLTWDGLTAALSSLFVPNSDHLQQLTSGLKDQVTDKFGIDFDLTVLVPHEKEIQGQQATFNFGGYAFTATVFDPSALVRGIEEFRPYIRGFVAIMLIFFVINQVYSLLGSAGVFGRRVAAGGDGS